MTFRAGPILLPTEADTAAFAGCIAGQLSGGDCLLLSGAIGAGKSAFARALIRAKLGRPQEDVPSPTFTLVQSYDAGTVTLWHADLYRLTHPDEAFELGLEEAFETGICLIEWPDRLGKLAPATALSLNFAATVDGPHTLSLSGADHWRDRVGRCLG